MATAKYGKSTVFAVVDPWLYDEYTDGRKLPQTYDNFVAGKELVRRLLQQVAEEGHSYPPPQLWRGSKDCVIGK
jgi:unsaturated rhamnogalacturonyl hydrolase